MELNPVLEVVLEQVKDRVLKQRVYFLCWGLKRYRVSINREHCAYLPLLLHYIYTGLSGAEAKSDLLLQVHTQCRASRKWFIRLKEEAAYNVVQHLNCDEDVGILQIPNSLKKLVRQFVITFSGDYIFDLKENWNKDLVKRRIPSTLYCSATHNLFLYIS